MIYRIFIFCIATLMVSPLAAKQQTSPWKSGEEWTSQIQTDYSLGKYAEFISEFNQRYYTEHKNAELGIHEQKEMQLEQEKHHLISLKTKLQELDQKSRDKLQDVAQKYPHERIVKMMESSVNSPFLNQYERNAYDYLQHLETLPNPPDRSPLLSKLASINKEYREKLSFLERKGDKNLEEKRFVLGLERNRKMLEVVKDSSNKELLYKVQAGTDAYKRSVAQDQNRKIFEALGNGELNPETDAEKKIGEIMQKSQRILQ